MSLRKIALSISIGYILCFIYLLYRFSYSYQSFFVKLSVIFFTGIAVFFGSAFLRKLRFNIYCLKKLDNFSREFKKRTSKNARKQDIVNEILYVLTKYTPPVKYNRETRYKDSLYGWLKAHFDEIYMELQKGSSRPDLIVKKDGTTVAIEIKGPTDYNGLKSIPDKLMRYYNHFDAVVVVLFDLTVPESYYKEWLKSLKRIFPNAVIIRFN